MANIIHSLNYFALFSNYSFTFFTFYRRYFFVLKTGKRFQSLFFPVFHAFHRHFLLYLLIWSFLNFSYLCLIILSDS